MSNYFSNNPGPITVRTSEGVADIIRREILSGKLKPDQALMERDIALELGVSRTPVREALFALQGEGLVTLAPRRGARVREITAIDISQIYSLRHVIETHSAESAAKFADSEAILNIETSILRQRNLGKNCSAIEQANADLAFHEAVSAASGSQILRTIANQVLAITATLRSRYKYDAGQTKQAYSQHNKILAAIKAKDPELSAQLMSDHIIASTKLAEKYKVD